ncbi:MAG: putative signal transducing protein [Leadbetterella sp.]
MDFTCIEIFSMPHEGYVKVSYLESKGIQCYLKDEFTVQTDFLLSNAVGGVKLMVLGSDLEKAKEAIEEWNSGVDS